MCHCEVLLYSGRSCCIEVVDRQDFFAQRHASSVNQESSLKEADTRHEWQPPDGCRLRLAAA